MPNVMNAPYPTSDNRTAIADFAELECLARVDRQVSLMDITRILYREADRLHEDTVREQARAAFDELVDRVKHCGFGGKGYPFKINARGTSIELKSRRSVKRPPELYIYLLLATRLNMKSERNQDGEDGAALFELLCKEIAANYWGGPTESVSSMVFGTARAIDLPDEGELDRTEFENAVNALCRQIGEGYRFQADTTSRVRAKDGKLDIVVCKNFADARAGKLIGFGQCKTGTHWERDLHKLQPRDFCMKWLLKSPVVDPVRMYFVTDRLPKDDWYDRSRDGGLLFDRCRIIEYSDPVEKPLMASLRKWVKAAAKAKGLQLP